MRGALRLTPLRDPSYGYWVPTGTTAGPSVWLVFAPSGWSWVSFTGGGPGFRQTLTMLVGKRYDPGWPRGALVWGSVLRIRRRDISEVLGFTRVLCCRSTAIWSRVGRPAHHGCARTCGSRWRLPVRVCAQQSTLAPPGTTGTGEPRVPGTGVRHQFCFPRRRSSPGEIYTGSLNKA